MTAQLQIAGGSFYTAVVNVHPLHVVKMTDRSVTICWCLRVFPVLFCRYSSWIASVVSTSCLCLFPFFFLSHLCRIRNDPRCVFTSCLWFLWSSLFVINKPVDSLHLGLNSCIPNPSNCDEVDDKTCWSSSLCSETALWSSIKLAIKITAIITNKVSKCLITQCFSNPSY